MGSVVSFGTARDAPAPLLVALLPDCDRVVSSLLISASALVSLTADLVARNDESVHQALPTLVLVKSARSALLARKTRVLGSAKRLFRKQHKMIVAEFEAADVSTEHLRVWAAVAGAGVFCSDAVAASPLLTAPRLVRAPAIGVSVITAMLLTGQLGRVVTGDGLRVMSAAGPGLQWFEPHSRNEFAVVLAQADGSVPVWLTADDIDVAVFSAVVTAPAGTGAATSASHGCVRGVYRCWGLHDNAAEVLLQLTVCGVAVADGAGSGDWCVHVLRRPLAAYHCSAEGTGVHVRTLAVMEGHKFGLAVSADERWLVVGWWDLGELSVYSLPGGVLVRTFGGRGSRPLQFEFVCGLCFAPSDNIIVVEQGNTRLQEVTLGGVFVRFIGEGAFPGFHRRVPHCAAVQNDVIAVGCKGGTGPRLVLLEFGTGAVMLCFGDVGTAPGQLSRACTGIRFTHDGSHVIIAEDCAKRLSIFSTAGEFVRCVGAGVLGGGFKDVLQSVTGEYVVTDCDNHRICVFSPDGLELVRSWGARLVGDGQSQHPCALAAAGRHLYVMDLECGRVQVFE